MSEETKEILINCTIEGNVVKLPEGQLERDVYVKIKKALEGIGGKWNKKEGGFLFSHDPSELMGRVKEGENINLKKDFQFFPTPTELAKDLVVLAMIQSTDNVLEPSAGQGAIVDAVLECITEERLDNVHITAIELMESNYAILTSKYISEFMAKKVYVYNQDFLKYPENLKEFNEIKGCSLVYNKIIANPPFRNNQDIDHVMAMWQVLAEGGRLVSVMSRHWIDSTNKKETQFREFLKTHQAKTIDVEAGTFKESGTEIATVVVVIDKPISNKESQQEQTQQQEVAADETQAELIESELVELNEEQVLLMCALINISNQENLEATPLSLIQNSILPVECYEVEGSNFKFKQAYIDEYVEFDVVS